MLDPDDTTIPALQPDPGPESGLPNRAGYAWEGDGLPWSNEVVAELLWQKLVHEVDF